MFNFFQSILDTLQILISYAVNLVSGLFVFVQSLVKGSAFLTATLALLPAPIIGVAVATVATVIIYMLIGKR